MTPPRRDPRSEPGRPLGHSRRAARGRLTDHAYNHLRSAIANGELAAGQAVSYSEICQVLDMSRTPVREAVIRLELEGYLQRDASNRLTVHIPDRTQVAETFWLREIIESYAVSLATQHISDDELDRLDELLDSDRDALQSRRVDLLAETNEAIHSLILGAARNRSLVSLVTGLRVHVQGLAAFAVGSFEDQAGFVRQHEEICVAMREGDVEVAVDLTRRHLRQARDVLLAEMGTGDIGPVDRIDLPDPCRLDRLWLEDPATTASALPR